MLVNFALAKDPLGMVRQSLSYNVHRIIFFKFFYQKMKTPKKINKVNEIFSRIWFNEVM